MGNFLGGGVQPALDLIGQAFAARQNSANVLIVGGGALCANVNNAQHTPHPHNAVTYALPNGPNVGLYVTPQYHGSILDIAQTRATIPNYGAYDVVHFENVDVPVVT